MSRPAHSSGTTEGSQSASPGRGRPGERGIRKWLPWNWPLKLDPRDDPFHGTDLEDEPVPYHLRLGGWRARFNRNRSDIRLYREGSWKSRAVEDGCSLILGPLVVQCWWVESLTQDQIEHEIADWNRAAANVWAEQRGVVLCRHCRDWNRTTCLMSPTCAEQWQRMRRP